MSEKGSKKIKVRDGNDSQAGRKELDELREQLESLQKEKDELLGKLQRVSADYVNFQKRVPKQVSDSIGYEKERVIRSLLPALDNFEHTLQKAHSAETLGTVIEAVQIIYDQMLDILKSHGVQQIVAVDEKFDPTQHEAMMRRSELDKEDGIVLEEFQRGYALNSRVIRPSKVVVNKLELEQPSEPKDSEQSPADGQADGAEQQSENVTPDGE